MEDYEGAAWQDVAKLSQVFQERRESCIPREWLLSKSTLDHLPLNVIDIVPLHLSAREIELTTLSASELSARISTRDSTSVEVTRAFCHRAAIAHQLTNCLTEIFFDEALEQAAQLDAILGKTGHPVGPLHGVPVSLKDHYNVKGHFTTAGYISFAKNPRKDKDALVVEILRKSGAVFFCKTNNPQCMMVLETVSNIYGRTLNPQNTMLGAGGSSGGEGALLAMRGSPLGIGSDIGGSVRVPAAFNGLYGFKPSGKRVPTSGWECTYIGQESITAVVGPMGHSMDDLDLFFKIVSDAKPWFKEPMLEMPWKLADINPEKKLRIGVMMWDEVVMPHPYIIRVIKEATDKLKAGGHELIDFKPYDHKRAWDEILLPLYFTDGGLDIYQTLGASGEPQCSSAKRLTTDPIVKSLTIHEIWKLHIARDTYKSAYMQRWNDTAQQTSSGEPIDVLLCPAAPLQGTPHDVKPWWGYSSQWNLLDYPSGVLPAGKVLKGDAYPANYTPVNELDKENYELYNNDIYVKLPVTLQVVGRTHQDEKVIAAMKIIDKVLNL